MARIVRGQTLSIRQREFIEAAVASGAGTARDHRQTRDAQRHRAGHRLRDAHRAADHHVREFPELSRVSASRSRSASLGTLIAEGAGEMEAAPWILLVPGGFLALLLLSLEYLRRRIARCPRCPGAR